MQNFNFIEIARYAFTRAAMLYPRIAIFKLNPTKSFCFYGITQRFRFKKMCAIMFYEVVSRMYSCNPTAFLDVVGCMLQYFSLNKDELMIFQQN